MWYGACVHVACPSYLLIAKAKLIQSEFACVFLSNFSPFAAPGKCRPVRPAPPHRSRYATAVHTRRVVK